MGRFDQAFECYEAARQVFVRLGVFADAARVDLNAALLIVDGAEGDGRDRVVAVGEALALGVPAVMALDSLRHQFARASDRLDWSATFAAHSLRRVFGWAAELGDAALVADLVETSLNSGVYVTGIAASDDLDTGTTVSRGMEMMGSSLTGDTIGEAVPGGGGSLAPSPGMAGATALVAGAVLPMAPPPRLLVPDPDPQSGRIALSEHQQALAAYSLPSVDNPVPLRTW